MKPSRPRTRLPAAEREEMIIRAAMDLIAEKGFNADTGELARRAGVSHGLVFRYFGNKEMLIERVYERNFLARWAQDWEVMLADRSVTLRDRLKAFYKSYLAVIDEYNWIRISMFSGLNGHGLTRRYIESFVEQVLTVIAQEVRHERNPRSRTRPSDDDIEIAWHLHSTFIYALIRRHIFGTRTLRNVHRHVDIVVDQFMDGAVRR
ncbi:MAG TPA: TetR/AcrR family transcriptional regulator [Hyphomicrobiaceae bacterium]|nr:TetR/AcrR family transcriptional regulator [Hyphomicrobiaceae bacterium]